MSRVVPWLFVSGFMIAATTIGCVQSGRAPSPAATTTAVIEPRTGKDAPAPAIPGPSALTDFHVYGITWGGDLYVIDHRSGEAVLVRSAVCSGANALTRMSDGTLLAASSTTDVLMRIDPGTGESRVVAQMPNWVEIRAIAALPDGRLLGIQATSKTSRNCELVEIDATSGEVAQLTALSSKSIQSLDAAADGILYAYDNYDRGLITIDPATGYDISRQRDFRPAVFQSIAFTPAGRMLGYTHNQTNRIVKPFALYWIDPSDGSLTLASVIRGKHEFRGIAVIPVDASSSTPSSAPPR